MSSSTIRHFASRSVAVGTFALAACLVLTFADVGRAEAVSQDVPLGTAASFAVLAGSTVTDVPATTTVISGDVGSSSGTSMTNLLPANLINGGAMFAADPGGVAAGAQVDLTAAYIQAAGQLPAIDAPVDLASANLTPGVYVPLAGGPSFSNSGNLTLTGTGAAGEYFVFQMASTLTMDAGSTITLINVSPCNVFWQVGSSATLGTNSTFVGTILADQSIAVANGAVIEGRLLARIGAVTLDNNTITSTMCTPTRATAAAAAAAAEAEAARLAATGFDPIVPAIAGFVVIGIGALFLARRRPRRRS